MYDDDFDDRPKQQPSKAETVRINHEIRVPEVRLIGDDGTQYGIVSIAKARELSNETGLDLVEISATAKPPLVKLIDYGKYKYQIQKKASEAKKKQVVVSVKEIKFRPHIEKHDLEVKLKSIKKFLEQGDKVKMLMQFRGREMAYKDSGLLKFEEIVKDLVDNHGALIESPLKLMGNRAITMIAPSKKK